MGSREGFLATYGAFHCEGCYDMCNIWLCVPLGMWGCVTVGGGGVSAGGLLCRIFFVFWFCFVFRLLPMWWFYSFFITPAIHYCTKSIEMLDCALRPRSSALISMFSLLFSLQKFVLIANRIMLGKAGFAWTQNNAFANGQILSFDNVLILERSKNMYSQMPI